MNYTSSTQIKCDPRLHGDATRVKEENHDTWSRNSIVLATCLNRSVDTEVNCTARKGILLLPWPLWKREIQRLSLCWQSWGFLHVKKQRQDLRSLHSTVLKIYQCWIFWSLRVEDNAHLVLRKLISFCVQKVVQLVTGNLLVFWKEYCSSHNITALFGGISFIEGAAYRALLSLVA